MHVEGRIARREALRCISAYLDDAEPPATEASLGMCPELDCQEN